MYISIAPEPNGLKVHKVEYTGSEIRSKELIGETPLLIPVKFCERGGVNWYEGCCLDSNDNPWCPAVEGRKHMIRYCLGDENHYWIYVNTYISFLDQAGKRPNVKNGEGPVTDGFIIRPHNSLISPIEHGRVFSRKIAEIIDQGDYHKAEKLRLKRIGELKDLLKEDDEFWNKVDSEYCRNITGATRKLIKLELTHLERIVGLLDGQLMSFRKRTLAILHQGYIDLALEIAKVIAAMEEEYFPKPAPAVVKQIQKTPERTQLQEQVIAQQKPYCGATDIVRALSAIRADRADPDVVREACGWATLSDLLGFGEPTDKRSYLNSAQPQL
jgi:hypothetical protein